MFVLAVNKYLKLMAVPILPHVNVINVSNMVF